MKFIFDGFTPNYLQKVFDFLNFTKPEDAEAFTQRVLTSETTEGKEFFFRHLAAYLFSSNPTEMAEIKNAFHSQAVTSFHPTRLTNSPIEFDGELFRVSNRTNLQKDFPPEVTATIGDIGAEILSDEVINQYLPELMPSSYWWVTRTNEVSGYRERKGAGTVEEICMQLGLRHFLEKYGDGKSQMFDLFVVIYQKRNNGELFKPSVLNKTWLSWWPERDSEWGKTVNLSKYCLGCASISENGASEALHVFSTPLGSQCTAINMSFPKNYIIDRDGFLQDRVNSLIGHCQPKV